MSEHKKNMANNTTEPTETALTRWSFYAIYGFLTVISLFMAPSNFCFVLIILLGLFRWRQERFVLQTGGVLFPWYLLLGWAALTIFWSPAGLKALTYLKWGHVLVFIAVINLPYRPKLWKNAFFILAGINAALLLFAPVVSSYRLQWPVFRRLAEWAVRYQGMFTISITYGNFLNLVIIIGTVWLFFHQSVGWKRAVGWGLILLLLAALLLTTSRTGLLALLVSLCFLAFMRRELRLIPLLFLFLIILPWLIPGMRNWQPVKPFCDRVENTIYSGYSSGREVIWRVGKVMIANSPVWGNGTGSVAMEYGRIVTSMRDVAPERRALRYGQLHNIYLQILAEWGVIGFSLFVFLLYSLTNPFYRWYRQNSNNTAALAALTLVVLQLSAGMFQCDFFNANVSRPFWLLMGILYMAAANHQQSNTLQQTKKSENDGISSFSSSDFVVS